jgi:hypothetical protein
LSFDFSDPFSVVIYLNFNQLLVLAIQPISNIVENFGPISRIIPPIMLLRSPLRRLHGKPYINNITPGNLSPNFTGSWIYTVNPIIAVWRNGSPVNEILKSSGHL